MSASQPDDLNAYQNDATIPPSARVKSTDSSAESPSAADRGAMDALLSHHDSTIPPVPQTDTISRAAAIASSVALPRVFGDYLLIEEIARGGMGVVFKAKQQRLNRTVAVKMILGGQLAGDEEIKRFYAEAEAAANLNHPGIVPIYEVGQLQGQHFFSMGFIDGPSLAQLIQLRPLDPIEAAYITKETAEAIRFAHGRGVIHRDLKPANVLLSTQGNDDRGHRFLGHPKITDFGLAKHTHGRSELTATGQILGTPAYMPPEQAAGDVAAVGPLADIYSLGGILYALLTGHAPFQAATPIDTLIQVIESDPVPPRQSNSKIPMDLETICLKCMQKDMRHRYQSADALIADLNCFLDGTPISARRITSMERAWRWSKKHPAIATLSFIIMALLATILVGAPLIAFSQAQLRLRESAAKNIAVEANQQLEVAKDDALNAHYAANISLAYSMWSQGELPRARQLLNEAPLEFRDWEWWFLDGLCDGGTVKLNGHIGKCVDVQFGSDNNLLAATTTSGAKRWDLTSGLALPAIDLPTAQTDWNRSATTFVGWQSNVATVYDFPNLSIQAEFRRIGQEVVSSQHALDSDRVAILRHAADSTREQRSVSKRWMIEVASVSRGRIVFSQDDIELIDDPKISISPSGKMIAAVGLGAVFCWCEQNNGQWQAAHLDTTGIQVDQIIFSPATSATDLQELLTVAGSDGLIRLCARSDNDSGWKVVGSLPSDGARITTLAWDSSAVWLAAGGNDRLVRVWQNRLPVCRAVLRGVEESVTSLSFSSQSTHLAAGTLFGVKAWPLPPNSKEAIQPRTPSRQDCQAVRVSSQPLTTVHALPNTSLYIVADSENRFFQFDAGSGAIAELPVQRWLRGDLANASILPPPLATKYPALVAMHPSGQRFAFAVSTLTGSSVAEPSSSIASCIIEWDLQEQRPLKRLDSLDCPVACLQYSPDGLTLVAATGTHAQPVSASMPHETNPKLQASHKIQLWHTESEEPPRLLHEQIEPFTCMAFSPDGRYIVAGGPMPTLKVIDMVDGKLVREIRSPARIPPTSLDWHPLKLRTRANELPDAESQYGLTDALPSDEASAGHRTYDCVVAGGMDGRIRIYDAQIGSICRILEGHTASVTDMEVMPGGQRISSSSTDGSLRVWSAYAGEQLLSLSPPAQAITAIAVCNREQNLAAVCVDGQLCRWQADLNLKPNTEKWLDLATLENAEWQPQSGKWTVQNLSLSATTEAISRDSSEVQLSLARASLSGMTLPDTARIQFRLRLTGGAGLQLLMSNQQFDGEMVELLTGPNPFTQRVGASIATRAGQQEFRELVSNPTLELMSDQMYDVEILRAADSLSVAIDGAPVLHSKVHCSTDVGLVAQVIYGANGSRADIEDWRVTCPSAAWERLTTSRQVENWLNEELLISRVQKRIEASAEWSEDLRDHARKYADSLAEDPAKMTSYVMDRLRDQTDSGAAIGTGLIEVALRAADLSGDWRDWFRLAQVYRLADQPQLALTALKAAVAKCRLSDGCVPHGVWMAVAQCNANLTNVLQATQAFQLALRTALLSGDAAAMDLIRTTANSHLPGVKIETGLGEAGEQLVLRLLQVAGTPSIEYAQEFRLIVSRATDIGGPQTVIDRTDWLKLQQLRREHSPIGISDFKLQDVAVEFQGDESILTFDTYSELTQLPLAGNAHIGWLRSKIILKLVREQAVWQLKEQIIRPVEQTKWRTRRQPVTEASLRVFGSNLNMELDKVAELSSDQLRELIVQLHAQRQDVEALRVTTELTGRSDVSSLDWATRAVIAADLAQVEVAVDAATTARKMDSSVQLPDYLQAAP